MGSLRPVEYANAPRPPIQMPPTSFAAIAIATNTKRNRQYSNSGAYNCRPPDRPVQWRLHRRITTSPQSRRKRDAKCPRAPSPGFWGGPPPPRAITLFLHENSEGKSRPSKPAVKSMRDFRPSGKKRLNKATPAHKAQNRAHAQPRPVARILIKARHTWPQALFRLSNKVIVSWLEPRSRFRSR